MTGWLIASGLLSLYMIISLCISTTIINTKGADSDAVWSQWWVVAAGISNVCIIVGVIVYYYIFIYPVIQGR
jgi:hypothetical protein